MKNEKGQETGDKGYAALLRTYCTYIVKSSAMSYIRSIINERYFYENKVLYTRIQQGWQIIQTNTFTLVFLFISAFTLSLNELINNNNKQRSSS